MKQLRIFLLVFTALALAAYLLRTPDADRDAALAKYAPAPSQFVESPDGLAVHYRDQGNRDGVPIVLLHGTAASLHAWEPLVAALERDYRLITLTLPGHGLTGPHPRDDYSFAGMADAIDLVTDELALERFVLGGNSMGGWLAWRYALAHPDRIEALLLLDPAGAPLRAGEDDPPLNIGFKLLGSPVGRFLLEHYAPRFLVRQSLLQSVSVEAVATEDAVDRYWTLLRLPGNRRAARWASWSSMTAFR